MQEFKVEKSKTFDIEQTLECGQIFRFKKIDSTYIVYSLNHIAKIKEDNGFYIIECDDISYFKNFFDLSRDYKSIQDSFKDDEFIQDALKYSSGIHILNQDPVEMIISFIISQNNNIPRIKSIIEKICESLGEDMGDYYAFPTLNKLAKAGEEFYKGIGAGYRAAYIDRVSNYLLNINIEEIKGLSTDDLRTFLLSLYGVGRKVCDCIILFGFSRMDSFPVDTWILKVFEDKFKGVQPDKLASLLVNMYGKTSGLVQQWLFFAKREKKI